MQLMRVERCLGGLNFPHCQHGLRGRSDASCLRCPTRLRCASGQSGFLLLEVMVSLLITAVGLLALASLHAAALRYGKLSQHRAVAVQLAQDMAERLRANKTQWGNYAFSQSFAAQAGSPAASSNACNTAVTVCSPSDLAQADLGQWRLAVRAALPEGSVHVLPDGRLAADVWVAWREPVPAADEQTMAGSECPASLVAGQVGVRCLYLRVQG